LTINLRLVFAVLFGVMSAVPMPVRAHPTSMHAAPTADAISHHAWDDAGHHGHGGSGHHHGGHLAAQPHAGDEPGAPQPADGAIPCHSAPCCMAVTQCLPSVPATVLLLLGRLVAQPAQIIVAVTPDPVVPPPRLQA
jgi:hypothetical protein